MRAAAIILILVLALGAYPAEAQKARRGTETLSSNFDINRYPTNEEQDEIAALPPAVSPVSSQLLLDRSEFAVLLPCIEMRQDATKGHSLVLINRCNFALRLEGYTVYQPRAGAGCATRSSEDGESYFSFTLPPGGTMREFDRRENCIGGLNYLRVQPPERHFEMLFGGQIAGLVEIQSAVGSARAWQREKTFDRETSAQFPRSDLCATLLPVKVGDDKPPETFGFDWAQATRAQVGEGSLTVQLARPSGRSIRIDFDPGIDREAVADAVNRIMYRCSRV